jgi:hypothetical protein
MADRVRMVLCVEGVPHTPAKNNAQQYSNTKNEQWMTGYESFEWECMIACAGSGMPSARGYDPDVRRFVPPSTSDFKGAKLESRPVSPTTNAACISE